jgi:NAD(P)H-nitrite reductase large subunit
MFLRSLESTVNRLKIPRSAVTKIEANILLSDDQTEDEIITFIRKNMEVFRFTDYEKERINDL